MNTLEKCENTMMRCWLTYEVACLLATQKNYALSKFYSKRCQREAEEVSSTTWWLNGSFVLISDDMQQGNVNEVRNEVKQAYEWSKSLQSAERIQAFLGKCAMMAGEAITSDERKAIVQREKDIIRVLDHSFKVETEVLFKRLTTLPNGRRFSVLPGKIRYGFDHTERCKRRQKGLTIIPGQPQTIPKPPVSKILGLQSFEM